MVPVTRAGAFPSCLPATRHGVPQPVVIRTGAGTRAGRCQQGVCDRCRRATPHPTIMRTTVCPIFRATCLTTTRSTFPAGIAAAREMGPGAIPTSGETSGRRVENTHAGVHAATTMIRFARSVRVAGPAATMSTRWTRACSRRRFRRITSARSIPQRPHLYRVAAPGWMRRRDGVSDDLPGHPDTIA